MDWTVETAAFGGAVWDWAGEQPLMAITARAARTANKPNSRTCFMLNINTSGGNLTGLTNKLHC